MQGKVRSPLVVILLSIVTLGIYTLYWHYAVFQEIKDRFGRGIGGVLGLVLGLFLLPVVWFVLPYEIDEDFRLAGDTSPVTVLTGFWNLLPIVGTIVWVVKVQGAMNSIWSSSTSLPAD